MAKYSLGDIVTLFTHPFSSSNTNIIVSGEHLLTPPTMLVTEIISREQHPEGGKEDSYKCLWFSNKKNDFPSNWFGESDIKKIEIDEVKANNKIIEGCLVTLKNLEIELGKKRSFLQIDAQGRGGAKKTSSISAHLPFVSPVMLVVSIEDFDETKLKSGVSRKDKVFPAKSVKCKYYNAVAEKFSEVFLPVEILTTVPAVTDELIKTLGESITSSNFLQFKNTIIKPVNLSNKSGYYLLSGFDLIEQKYKELEVHKMESFNVLEDPFIESAPKFVVQVDGDVKQLIIKKDIRSLITSAIAEVDKKYLHIKYTDNFGNVTMRTIDNYEVIMGPDDLDDSSNIEYLNAYCNLRKAERNFKIKSISEVSKVHLGSPIRPVK